MWMENDQVVEKLQIDRNIPPRTKILCPFDGKIHNANIFLNGMEYTQPISKLPKTTGKKVPSNKENQATKQGKVNTDRVFAVAVREKADEKCQKHCRHWKSTKVVRNYMVI